MNQLESQSSFLTTVIREQAPQEVLQVGLGNFDLTLSVCRALNDLDNSALTLLTPNLIQHSDFLKEVTKRGVETLMELVELNRTPADEVLPDLYFQNRSINMAIVNDMGQFDQALVALYYVDKMLVSRGTLVINNANNPVMRKLCHYLVAEREYSLQRTFGGAKGEALLPRLLRSQFHKAPEFVKNTMKTLINPDLLRLDEDPRLQGSMVVLTRRVEEGEIDMDFDTLLESIMNE
ncbi:MAG: hypothetical protein R3175_06505 [Marinobacter sp.]|uniref:hypothetical protein n=1 Tax=Marinobacter sp. TaxID=50741 RepID=UPI00299EBD5C|nr:hypothetical protein [Marinobacter sp.]MDX1755690.1 hypothetical protein [Marinobacter sp.]